VCRETPHGLLIRRGIVGTRIAEGSCAPRKRAGISPSNRRNEKTKDEDRHAAQTGRRSRTCLGSQGHNAAQIGVSVDNGTVTLLGAVDSYAEKWAANDASKRVSGLRARAEDLTVKLTGVHARDDSAIAAAGLHALDWDVWVPSSVALDVEAGWRTWRMARPHIDFGTRTWPKRCTVSLFICSLGWSPKLSLPTTSSANGPHFSSDFEKSPMISRKPSCPETRCSANSKVLSRRCGSTQSGSGSSPGQRNRPGGAPLGHPCSGSDAGGSRLAVRTPSATTARNWPPLKGFSSWGLPACAT